jgi:hypothetical protein
MALVKVSTPVPGYSGSVGGVHFADGHALVDPNERAAEMAYFHARGYAVEEVVDDEEPAADVGSAEEPAEPNGTPMPARNASTQAWQAWAVEHGGLSEEDAAANTRDQLVELFAGSETN